MRIATYNVNGINGRLPVLLRWLDETSPDIVCLQELKAPHEKFPLKAIEDAGYHAIWHGQKSWNGVAILSRYDGHAGTAARASRVILKIFTAVISRPSSMAW
jgi:exodeoxyribonuclease-3